MSIGLESALKALSASRLGIQTAGQNIANAGTAGYSRQRVLISADLPFTSGQGFQIGTGVKVNGIDAIFDRTLETRLRMQISSYSEARVDYTQWNSVESLLNEPGNGLSTDLAGFFDMISQLQTDPSQRSLRSGVVQSAGTLTQSLNLLSSNLASTTGIIFDTVNTLAQQVNQTAAQIASLNQQILAAEAGRTRANDLRDTREQLTKQIADVVDVRVFERQNGAIDVLVDGSALVRGDSSVPLVASRDQNGTTTLALGRKGRAIQPTGGQIAALLRHERGASSNVLGELDRLARNMALEFNRVQTTGVPLAGSFKALSSAYAVADSDNDGDVTDELLASSSLPFSVQKGELYVTVTNSATGALDRQRIDIDPGTTTVGDFVSALSNTDHLNASVDPTGRIRVLAEAGYGFDFANRLDAQPDSFGSFGGASPAIGTAAAGPFDLAAALVPGPATFTVDVDGSSVPVSLDVSEFASPSAVTASELANAINADLGTAATAKEVGGRLVIRSNSSGTSATLQLNDGSGSPLAALGMPSGTQRSGQIGSVDPAIFGKYTGSANGQLSFVPDGDGMIGVTPNLSIGVFDESGARIATLDVGSSYSPGDTLNVAQGVQVAFGPGQISASFNDAFALDTIADADTSDVLVALGLNAFFLGTTAGDLEVNPDILANADLLATGLSGAPGDSDNLLRMLQLRNAPLSSLEGQSFEDFYNTVVGDVGFETASARASVDVQDQLLIRLQQERDSISGVSIDEELVDLVRFQQAFQAASRVIDVVNNITDTLLSLAR